jgi:hypothetical protein
MTITFASGARNIEHKPITLRNADSLREWAQRCMTYARTVNESEMSRAFVDITRQHPELLRLIDITGAWNAKTMQQRLDERRKQHERACEETGEVVPFNEDEYRDRITGELQTELQNMIKETPIIARLLQFTSPTFPADLEALKLGIECIKAVAISDHLQGIDDDEWLDVSAVEVAAWVGNFCAKVAG